MRIFSHQRFRLRFTPYRPNLPIYIVLAQSCKLAPDSELGWLAAYFLWPVAPASSGG